MTDAAGSGLLSPAAFPKEYSAKSISPTFSIVVGLMMITFPKPEQETYALWSEAKVMYIAAAPLGSRIVFPSCTNFPSFWAYL